MDDVPDNVDDGSYNILIAVYNLLKSEYKRNPNPVYNTAIEKCKKRKSKYRRKSYKQRRRIEAMNNRLSRLSVEEFNKNRTCNILTRGLITPNNSTEANHLKQEAIKNLDEMAHLKLENLITFLLKNDLNPEIKQQVLLWYKQLQIVENYYDLETRKMKEWYENEKLRLERMNNSVCNTAANKS